jgi:hypothetical protein
LLARDIVGELRQTAIEFGHALAGTGFLTIQCFPRDDQPLQRRRRFRLNVTQARKNGRCVGLRDGGHRLRFGALRDQAHREIARALTFGDADLGRKEAEMEERRLGLAHLRRDRLVTDGLARLTLQGVELSRDLPDNIL